MQPGTARSTEFQIQLAPSPKAWTMAKEVTPRRRRDGPQLRRNTFDAAIMANATATVGSGRRSVCHSSGVAGSPDSRFEITAIFRSFHFSSQVFTLPASTASSISPFAATNAVAVASSCDWNLARPGRATPPAFAAFRPKLVRRASPAGARVSSQTKHRPPACTRASELFC